jgi:hypothetical protein
MYARSADKVGTEETMRKGGGEMKIDRLIQQAKSSAMFRGHSISRFSRMKNAKYLAVGRCKKCGAYVGVNAKPRPNEIEICGEGVAMFCTGKEKEE